MQKMKTPVQGKRYSGAKKKQQILSTFVKNLCQLERNLINKVFL